MGQVAWKVRIGGEGSGAGPRHLPSVPFTGVGSFSQGPAPSSLLCQPRPACPLQLACHRHRQPGEEPLASQEGLGKSTNHPQAEVVSCLVQLRYAPLCPVGPWGKGETLLCPQSEPWHSACILARSLDSGSANQWEGRALLEKVPFWWLQHDLLTPLVPLGY